MKKNDTYTLQRFIHSA